MGTNYYLHTSDVSFAEDHFDAFYPHHGTHADLGLEYEYEMTSPIDGAPLYRKTYHIHLYKHSFGWKPALQWYPDAYRSFKEMAKFLKENQDKFEIFDEYGDPVSVDEFLFEIEREHDIPDLYEHSSSNGYQVHSDAEGYEFLAFDFR